MINLFDNYNSQTKDLIYTLKTAGIDNQTLMAHDNGSLPVEITSPIKYFLNNNQTIENNSGKGLYYNRLVIPRFHEIIGTGESARVEHNGRTKAKIFYHEPKFKRLIKHVDWLDDKGNVMMTDSYNLQGQFYSRLIFNESTEKLMTSYYNLNNQVTMIENHVTKDFIVDFDGKNQLFNAYFDLFSNFVNEVNHDNEGLILNSLSLPYLYSFYNSKPGDDILVWQEEIGDSIPGNMTQILNGNSSRIKRIIVPKKRVYDRMLELIPENQHHLIGYSGYLYDFQRETQYRKNALIVTNSDQIEQIEPLIQTFPEMVFSITALTEMSNKLSALSSYDNVILYPNISDNDLANLFTLNDIYFDINHYSEVNESVRVAFENNLLIYAYNETLHQKDYVAPDHRFNSADFELMAQDIRKVTQNQVTWARRLTSQQKHADATNIDQVKRVFNLEEKL